MERIKSWSIPKRLIAALLALAVLASAAAAVTLTLWDEADAAAPQPGTTEYYDKMCIRDSSLPIWETAQSLRKKPSATRNI